MKYHAVGLKNEVTKLEQKYGEIEFTINFTKQQRMSSNVAKMEYLWIYNVSTTTNFL